MLNIVEPTYWWFVKSLGAGLKVFFYTVEIENSVELLKLGTNQNQNDVSCSESSRDKIVTVFRSEHSHSEKFQCSKVLFSVERKGKES